MKIEGEGEVCVMVGNGGFFLKAFNFDFHGGREGGKEGRKVLNSER